MSHTNATTHYALSQFISTDTPGWMTDINEDNVKVDTALFNNATAIEANTTAISTLTAGIFDMIYPVGSIYMTTVSAFNPGTAFGGTWERIQDKFLLAAGASHANGSTGGEETHTLSLDEIPPHTHGTKSLTGSVDFRAASNGTDITRQNSGIVSKSLPNIGGNPAYLGFADNSGGVVDRITVDASHEHSTVGAGDAHNNMPPYMTVMIWKRTA